MSAVPHPSQERTGRIGASDAAAILGFSKWRTPMQVKSRILGEPDEEASEAAHWGTLLEPLLGDEFARRTGKRLRRHNATLRHQRHDFITGHIDYRVVGERALLECKTANQFMAKDWQDGPPAYYLTQAYVYLAITGWERAYFALLLGGQKFLTFDVAADPQIQDAIIERLAAWWQQYIIHNENPPAVNHDDLTRMYQGGGAPIEMDEAIAETMYDLDVATQELREAKDRVSQLQFTVKRFMGDATVLTDNGRPAATWTTQERRTVDTERLRSDHPELFPEYLKTSTSRVFRVK